MDFGASCDRLSDRNLFNQPESTPTRTTTLGDGTHIHVHKKGSVFIEKKVSKGSRNTLKHHNVILVPELDTTLVSCPTLDTEGYTTVFQGGWCYIIQNDTVLCTAKMEVLRTP